MQAQLNRRAEDILNNLPLRERFTDEPNPELSVSHQRLSGDIKLAERESREPSFAAERNPPFVTVT
jgi:hypothetical protein